MAVTDFVSHPRSARVTTPQVKHEPVFGVGAPGSAALSRPAVADLIYRVRCAIFRMHDFQVKVVPGRVCLACHHCGKHSGGWEMTQPTGVPSPTAAVVAADSRTALDALPMRMARVLHHAPRPQQQDRAAAI
jgi:hypothetical protein